MLFILQGVPSMAAPVRMMSPARLPDDLERQAGDPALLQKPEGLQVASYVFALHDRLYAPGWTEGHYLLPDNRFGYGMLDALAEALGKENPHQNHGYTK